MFPPSNGGYLYLFSTCESILHVVDLPLVPVTTMLLQKLLNMYIKSISVIILFLYFLSFSLFFDFNRLTPGLKTI